MVALVMVTCGTCGRQFEIWPGADVFCPTCQRWTSPRAFLKTGVKTAGTEELKAVEMERAKRRREAGIANPPTVGQTRDKVAAAIGLRSGRAYNKALKAWKAVKVRKLGRLVQQSQQSLFG